MIDKRTKAITLDSLGQLLRVARSMAELADAGLLAKFIDKLLVDLHEEQERLK